MAQDSKVWRCGKYELTFDRPRIMGVLNVTPDSFSDGGKNFNTDAAIAAGLKMLDEGADIVDVGGESTRPGFTPVSPDEEARRVLPVVRALAHEGAIVSVDTRHVEVAKAAVRCGASIVNDVTGFTDPQMVEFVKASNCGVIIMHAGEVSDALEERRPRHATVQLDTSAAAYAAERARARAAAQANPAPRRRSRILGGSKQMKNGMVQGVLPFAEAPNGSAAQEAAEAAAKAAAEAKAAEEAAAKAKAEADAKAQQALEGKSAEEMADALASNDVNPADAAVSDQLESIMRKSNQRYEAYKPTSQLRRFTLPDSAPIKRRIMGFLSDQARALVRAGVARERICIDPGAGFGKDAGEDIVIQRETANIASLGYPLLCAVSRKRFIGAVSGVEQAGDRDAATFGVCLGAIQNGANIVRVHDVAGFAQVLNGFWAVAKPQPRRAFVALGSNMGQRLDNICRARDLIADIPLTCVSQSSRIYESEPAYNTDQPAFANAVIEIKSELAPIVLLDELLAVETKMGRDRSANAQANGPRKIDVDLLWMDGEVHGGKKLRLPHPMLGDRDFVMVPLEDLMHNPARFFRYAGVDVKEPEDRVGKVTKELGTFEVK